MTSVNTNKIQTAYSKENITKEEKKKTPQVQPQETPKGDYKKINGAVLATALSAAVIGGLAGRNIGLKSCKKEISKLQSSIADNNKITQDLQNGLNEAKKLVSDLTESNKLLKEQNANLEEANKGAEKLKEIIDEVISGDTTPENTRAKFEALLRKSITENKPNYDIMSPPVKEEISKVIKNAVNLPEITKSGIESNKLKIPEISATHGFDYQVPIGGKLNIAKGKVNEITEQFNLPTSLSKEYNDALQNWDDDKIARDILQNFYDGHGQTLDGVRMQFTPIGNGKFKVRISGDSTYTHDKALLFGSEKSSDSRAAGNYGEGLKITVLKLLKDKGAQNVSAGSQNWTIKYKMDNKLFEGRDVMAYDVLKANEFVDGSYFEFETSDKGILEALRNSIDRFYHSNNPDFQNLDFDSEKIGIKILPRGQKGGLYIAGQRFEFDNNYDGLDGFNFIIKEKLPEKVIDPSRDRTPLNKSDLESIGKYIATGLGDNQILSADETGKLIKACERYWTKVGKDAENPLAKFLESFIRTTSIWKDNLKFKFPDKYIAYSQSSPEIVADLMSKGYVICNDSFSEIGMKNIRDAVTKGRAHTPIQPTKIQQQKINIIKEAIKALQDSLKKEFTASELDTKIYLFDAKSEQEKKLYENVLAEAIVELGESKGFWIDRKYLDESSFSDVLSTALHEMSHKAGGDESMSFSYKLTDVLAKYSEGTIKDSLANGKLKILDKLWDELQQAG